MNPNIIYVWCEIDSSGFGGGWKASWTKPEGKDCLQIEVEQFQERPLLWDEQGNEIGVEN